MNRVFKISAPFRVPDGTLVSPFLNSRDSMSGLPFDLVDSFSLAAGIIEPGTKSKIHVMPCLTQVTFVRTGKLDVRMKGPQDTEPYVVPLEPNQAALTRPGTFLQLINDGVEPCTVLYIVSPPYLFDKSGEIVIYDDAVVLDEGWDDLAAAGWKPSKPLPTQEQRQAPEQLLAERAMQRGLRGPKSKGMDSGTKERGQLHWTGEVAGTVYSVKARIPGEQAEVEMVVDWQAS